MDKTILVRNNTKENPGFCSYSIGFYKSYVSCRKSDLQKKSNLFKILLAKNENILLDGYNNEEISQMLSRAESLAYKIIWIN